MRKVKVITKCGEEFTLSVDTEQEIESIEEIIESSFNDPKSLYDVKKMVEHLHGGTWRFSTNTEKTTYEQLMSWVKSPPEDVVIVPWAFYGSYRYKNYGVYRSRLHLDTIRYNGNSVWVRTSTSTTKGGEE